MDPSVHKSAHKGVRFLGHPLHPATVHAPIGAWVLSAPCDLLFLLRSDPFWWRMAFWAIAFGLLFAALTLTTGLIEAASVATGSPAEPYLERHMSVALATAFAYVLSLWSRLQTPAPSLAQASLAMGLSLVGLILLTWTGWLGGELAYRFGLGSSRAREREQGEDMAPDGPVC